MGETEQLRKEIKQLESKRANDIQVKKTVQEARNKLEYCKPQIEESKNRLESSFEGAKATKCIMEIQSIYEEVCNKILSLQQEEDRLTKEINSYGRSIDKKRRALANLIT